ncbi:acyltransferase family protein [Gorillibacterium massiliense]|uniref:acyltransferase family protein n=1 Tax=Gorillibacterium massiliense TaxID=1280390 RepID=UPI0004B87A93|nr:acyltransferase family protein [Gorillibacterium massiliense]
MPDPLKENRRYMTGLDGLRAIAVLAVIAYHLNLKWAPGGLLGVGIFFTLSGYLITDLMIAEKQDTGRIDLKQFWFRRARRLLPAMFVMLAVVCVVVALTGIRQPSLHGDAWAAAGYISNWWLIFHKVSYFESFGPPSPLGHLWSLAVEEQFYLLWPLLLALLLRISKRRGILFSLTLAIAALSALAMLFLYTPGEDPSRVYYGTDTRAFGLLIGAALAVLWPSRKLRANISAKSRRMLDTAGIGGLLAIFYMIWQTDQYGAGLYKGGLVLLSAATAMVVAVLAHPASQLGKLMGSKPLRWLGARSYGIYLWHFPIIVLTSPEVNTNGFDLTRCLLQIAASVSLAAISYKYIEDPIRKGAIQTAFRKWRSTGGKPIRLASRTGLMAVTPFLAIVLIGVGMIKLNPIVSASATLPTGTAANQPAATATSTPNKIVQNDNQTVKMTITQSPEKETASSTSGKTAPPTATPHTPAKTAKPKATVSTQPTDQPKPNPTDTPKPTSTVESTSKPDPISGKGMIAIGDSVMLDIGPYLEKLLPGIHIDGKIGRQMSEGAEILMERKAAGTLGDFVIIELGTNGTFSKKTLESLMSSLEDVPHVMLINTRVPRPWQDSVNESLAAAAAKYSNVTFLDWYKTSAGHDSFFYSDGVHLTPDGSEFYASFVAEAIRNCQTES